MDESRIFAEALKLATPAGRAAYLDAACAGSARRRSDMEALLRAHAAHPDFLEHPPGVLGRIDLQLPELARAEGPGAVLAGRYTLRRRIGEGGMGLVFLADQQRPVRREVALKVIKPGLGGRDIVARFEAERQALALMDHPNIARVLDAGTTENGRPFFVMELVKGIPINEYCEQQRLTPCDRLGLFLSVCRAMHHAHGKGIIHRDLKPSNILAAPGDGDGVPAVKVIDFGIAKSIGPRLTERMVDLDVDLMIGTPPYMSPEQAESHAPGVDVRSDVYSLGVLLYELLTGTTPFDRRRLEEATHDEIRRILREEAPPKPSTRLVAPGATTSAGKKAAPAEFATLLRGDLDRIVMKALEKDRRRRYETASAFAADILRYLHDEPVQACPSSIADRVRRFVRRNKGPVAAAPAPVSTSGDRTK